jgi:excisionase family DNA binding protein
MTDTLAYPPDRAARILGVSERTLRRMRNDGKVKSVNIGARVVYPRSELERLVPGGNSIEQVGRESAPVGTQR